MGKRKRRWPHRAPKNPKGWLNHLPTSAGSPGGDLAPRRAQRATAVNWLLAWLAQQGEPLPEQGPLGTEFPPPADPVQGHPGDLPIK